MKTTENVAALIGTPKFYILGAVEVENPRDNYLSFDHQYTDEVFTSLDSAKKTAQDILCDYDHATMCIDEYSTEGIENYESIQDFIYDSEELNYFTEKHITVRLEFKNYGNMTVYVKDGHDRYNFEIHYSGDNLFPEEYENYEEAMAGHENHFRDMIKDHLIDNSTNTDTVANDDIDYIISTIRTSISPYISNYFN